jgi:hypothetical protein
MPPSPASPPETASAETTEPAPGEVAETKARRRRGRAPHPVDLLRHATRDRAPKERKKARHRSSIEEARETLLGSRRDLTLTELAERAGVPIDMARKFWRGMGFPNVQDDARVFTEADAESLRGWHGMVERGVIDEQTMLSLLRALSYTVDQLTMWQVEAAVDYQERRYDLDDIAARIVVLNGLPKVADFGIQQLEYAWRRRMVAVAERLDNEIMQRSQEPQHRDVLPLPRALGPVHRRRPAHGGQRRPHDDRGHAIEPRPPAGARVRGVGTGGLAVRGHLRARRQPRLPAHRRRSEGHGVHG